MTKLVDEVAKAIGNDPDQPCVFDAECTLGDLCFCKASALRALTAIEASDTHRVVPVNGTVEIHGAYYREQYAAGAPTAASSAAVWAAMLAAAPKVEE